MFDPKKPHGVNTPIVNNRAYWQNGKTYDIHFNEVDAAGNIVAKAPAKPTPPAPKGPALLKAVRPVAVKQPSADDRPAAPAKTEAKDSDIDLVAWAKDEKKYPWFSVRKAVSDKHGVIPAKAADAKHMILGA